MRCDKQRTDMRVPLSDTEQAASMHMQACIVHPTLCAAAGGCVALRECEQQRACKGIHETRLLRHAQPNIWPCERHACEPTRHHAALALNQASSSLLGCHCACSDGMGKRAPQNFRHGGQDHRYAIARARPRAQTQLPHPDSHMAGCKFGRPLQNQLRQRHPG